MPYSLIYNVNLESYLTLFGTETAVPVDQSKELSWESSYTEDSLLDDIHLSYIEHLLCHNQRQARTLMSSQEFRILFHSGVKMSCISIARFLAVSLKQDESLIVVPCVGMEDDTRDWSVDFSRSEFIDCGDRREYWLWMWHGLV